VLKASAIGDTVILSSSLQVLRSCFPEAEITFFVGASNKVAAELVCESLPGYQASQFRIKVLPMTSPLKSLRLIRAERFDLWLDFGTWSRLEAVYSFFSRSGSIVGFASPGQGRHFAYDRTVEHSPTQHENLNYLRLVESVIGPESTANPSRLQSKRPFLQGPPRTPQPRPYAILHLFAGGSQAAAKEWPEERWAKLAHLILQEGFQVKLTGGPADKARLEAFVQAFFSETEGVIEICAGQSLRQTVELLAQASLVVSIDTGLMHMASALDVPLFALYGATSSGRWGGLGSRTWNLDAETLESAPLKYGFEKASLNSLEKLSVDQVWRLIQGKVTDF
jgi:heptosyltransferase I